MFESVNCKADCPSNVCEYPPACQAHEQNWEEGNSSSLRDTGARTTVFSCPWTRMYTNGSPGSQVSDSEWKYLPLDSWVSALQTEDCETCQFP